MPVPSSVSAIVLTYKRPKELSGVLDNLINQHRPPDEIIVIDNDPEGSGRAANHLGDPTVRYMCPGENLGVAEGRNRAAAHAQGELLIFIDDDARFEKFSAITSMINCFTEDDIAVLAFLVRNAETKEIVPKEYPGYSVERHMDVHDVGYFLGGACAILRSAYEKLKGYDDVIFYGGEEVDFSFRLTKANLRIRYIPDINIFHRASPDGRDKVQDAFWLIRNRIYIAYKHLPIPFMLSHFLVWGCFALGQAIKTFKLGDYFRGLAALKNEGLLARAKAYRQESPMQKDTVQYLLKVGGRMWY